MIKDGKILLGKAQDQEIFMIPSQMNRHGLIAGASGLHEADWHSV